MNDRKGRKAPPQIEVLRRPGVGATPPDETPAAGPAAPAPAPVPQADAQAPVPPSEPKPAAEPKPAPVSPSATTQPEAAAAQPAASPTAPFPAVVVRPAGASPVRPMGAPFPRPVPGAVPRPLPRPSAAGAGPIRPRTSVPGSAPRPSGPGFGGPSTGAGPGAGRPPGGPPRFGPRTPRPPPTEAEVNALAVREHVPYRIARGELEGKMKARIWRKLHAEEAKRFDQVYEIMSKFPGVDLPDAFGILQSGLTPEEFKLRKERTQKKVAVRQARSTVDAAAVEHFVNALVAEKAELSVVLGERAFLDMIAEVEPIAFRFERSGRLEKLQVVLLARRGVWEKVQPQVERDPKLAQKPAPAIRQPERRPVSDPRPFTDHVGSVLDLTLRNGIRLAQRLQAVGPFDLLLGESGPELFVPLHAVLTWQAQTPAEATDGVDDADGAPQP